MPKDLWTKVKLVFIKETISIVMNARNKKQAVLSWANDINSKTRLKKRGWMYLTYTFINQAFKDSVR
jgi:hypothetical protein